MSETPTARRRRARAEAPETGTDPETDAEEAAGEEGAAPEPIEAPDPADAEAAKLRNAKRKFRRDLEGIVGPLEGFEDCPLCTGMGLVPEAGKLEVRSDTERCPECKGLGKMLTGSLVQEHAALPCPRCNDSGYIHKAPENVAPIAAAPVQPALPAQQVHGYWDAGSQTFVPYGSSAGGA